MNDMRKRDVIEKDGTRLEILILEVLLDIRELLCKQSKREKKTKRSV